MGKIDNYIEFVKEQVSVQERLARKFDDDPYRKNIHLKSASSFAALAKFLEEIQNKGTQNTAYLNRGDSPQKRILLTFEDIDNAPDDLLKELNISDTDKQELLIEYLIAKSGGVLSLDRIMVELYKKTGDVPRRNTITSRLYRMAARGMIYNVPGKKGVYSTYELSEQDAKKMFGSDGDGSEELLSTPNASTNEQKSSVSPDEQKPTQPNTRPRFVRRI